MPMGIGLSVSPCFMMGSAPVLPWPWLPEASAAPAGQEGTLLRHGTASLTVKKIGSVWVDLSTGAEITNPWLPYGATLVVDHKNNRYYWGGSARSKTDLTEVSVGGFTRHRLDGQNLGLTNDITVLMEFTTPPKAGGTSPFVGTPGVFCLAEQGYAQRFEFNARSGTSVDGMMTAFQLRVGGTSATDVWASGVTYPLATGVRRFIYSGSRDAHPLLGSDGWDVATGTYDGVGTFNVNRLSFGYRAIGTGVIDMPMQSDAMYNSLRVIVWPYAMSQEEVERALEFSEVGLLPLLFMHDSYGMSYGTANQTDLGIAEHFKQADAAAGYRCVRASVMGGTGWYLDNGVNTSFLDRLALGPDRIKKFTLAVLEKWDEDGATISAGIDAARTLLGHERWVVADTAFGLGDYAGGSNPAGAALYAAARPVVEAKCGEAHWLSLYDWMRSHVVEGTDETSHANGTWLQSQFAMPDTVHLNGTIGHPLYAERVEAALSALGLTSPGQWL